LLAGFSAAFLFANGVSGLRLQTVFLEGCVLIIWVASNLRRFEKPASGVDRHDKTGY
jgi:hypothetical protein